MHRRGFLRGASGTLALGLSACAESAGSRRSASASGPNVLGVARANGLQQFVRAADRTDLGEILAGPGPFTLFAPTDRAFASSEAGRLDTEGLRALIAYHVVPGQLTTDFLDGVNVNHTTLLGSSLNIDGASGLRVNGANVTRADLPASNGVVFAIDSVLAPR